MTRIYFSNDQRTVEQLLVSLVSENWAERRDVARELGYRGNLSAVMPLIQALNDSRSDVRDQAILSLGILGDKQAIEPLVVMFSNPNHAYVSARALSRIKSRKVVKPLIAGLKSNNKTIRLSAAEVLGEIRDQRAVEPLIEALSDEENSVRMWAATSLGELKDKRAVIPLLTSLRSKEKKVPSDDRTAWYAFSDEDVQARAIMALGNLGERNAIKPILKFLTSENRYLIDATIFALGELQAQAAVKPLLRILNNYDKTNLSRHFAAVALGKIGDKRVFDSLLAALSDDYEVIRIAAVDGLGYLGDSRALPALILARKKDKGIDEFGESVRNHAMKAIRRIQRREKNKL